MSNDQKLRVIGVVVITKNQDNSIVPPSGKDAIIAASSGIFSLVCRSRGGQSRRGQSQRREANLIEPEQDEEAFASEAMSASSTSKKSATKFFAHLHLVYKGKTKVVRAQIDSASTCNTIPEESLHKLFPGIKISKSKTSNLAPKGTSNSVL